MRCVIAVNGLAVVILPLHNYAIPLNDTQSTIVYKLVLAALIERLGIKIAVHA